VYLSFLLSIFQRLQLALESLSPDPPEETALHPKRSPSRRIRVASLEKRSQQSSFELSLPSPREQQLSKKKTPGKGSRPASAQKPTPAAAAAPAAPPPEEGSRIKPRRNRRSGKKKRRGPPSSSTKKDRRGLPFAHQSFYTKGGTSLPSHPHHPSLPEILLVHEVPPWSPSKVGVAPLVAPPPLLSNDVLWSAADFLREDLCVQFSSVSTTHATAIETIRTALPETMLPLPSDNASSTRAKAVVRIAERMMAAAQVKPGYRTAVLHRVGYWRPWTIVGIRGFFFTGPESPPQLEVILMNEKSEVMTTNMDWSMIQALVGHHEAMEMLEESGICHAGLGGGHIHPPC